MLGLPLPLLLLSVGVLMATRTAAIARTIVMTRTTELNITNYLPSCASLCVGQTLDRTGICEGLTDADCLCDNFVDIVIPSRECFISGCGGNETIEDVRSQVSIGWENYCNDAGTSINLSSTGTTNTTNTTIPTSWPSEWPAATSTSPAASSTASPAVAAGHKNLTTAMKAGIGVGAGVGLLVTIGGLIFLGYRLGHRKALKNEKNFDSPGDDEKEKVGSDVESGTLPSPTSDDARLHRLPVSGGATVREGARDGDAEAAELESPLSPISPLSPLGELPVHERPAELWHGIMPAELDPAAEIPIHRVLTMRR
ncbi:hypothetical protein F5Y16DRAFT_370692 [Xylariaceae sp. FL0255]|nr:hypothetical protein F5Y16DRAFT_370692 [Xylariaceae sp. FL0255]